MDRNSLQDQGFLPFRGQRPTLGPSDEIGILQLLGMSLFIHLECFRHGSLSTLCGRHIGVGFSKLHFEHPGEDLGFLSSAEIAPQLCGLLVVLLIQGKKVCGERS
jgi:hypothetical protein